MEILERLPGVGIEYEMEPGSLTRFKVLGKETGGAFEVYERELPAHTIGADPHYHRSTEEFFYIVAGSATILMDRERKVYPAGSTIVVPRMTVHGYWNESDERIKLLVAFCPAHDFDEYFRVLSELKHGPKETYAENLAALRARFDAASVNV
jgi:quercetin dioxygenase-like cupin family protein